MGCKRVMITLGKGLLQEITPPGLKLLTTIVELISTTDWSEEDKRERAVEMAKGALKDAGIEARENAIRATNEMMLRGLKELGTLEMEIVGTLTIEEADAVEIVEV